MVNYINGKGKKTNMFDIDKVLKKSTSNVKSFDLDSVFKGSSKKSDVKKKVVEIHHYIHSDVPLDGSSVAAPSPKAPLSAFNGQSGSAPSPHKRLIYEKVLRSIYRDDKE